MVRGVWMRCRQDEALLRICSAAQASDTPCADSNRAPRWRLSLTSLLLLSALLSERLCLCAALKLRSRDSGPWQPWATTCGPPARNLSKPAAPAPRCGDAHAPPSPESACAAVRAHRARVPPFSSSSSSSSFSFLSPSSLLLAYFANFSLSFCDSYAVSDLLLGMRRPESLDCAVEKVLEDLGSGDADHGDLCASCIEAYVRLDQHAQEKYEEFDFLFLKFLSGDYSVRSHTEDCKAVYKAWLCSEYFNATQRQCHHRIPCKQYCSEVQTRCPFVLPDNDDLVYGGLSSFICTGLLENDSTNEEPECCDVRQSSCDPAVEGVCNTSAQNPGSPHWQQQQRQPQPVSAASPRPCGGGRIRLCVLVLILLHTVVTFTGTQNHSGVVQETFVPVEENSTREE